MKGKNKMTKIRRNKLSNEVKNFLPKEIVTILKINANLYVLQQNKPTKNWQHPLQQQAKLSHILANAAASYGAAKNLSKAAKQLGSAFIANYKGHGYDELVLVVFSAGKYLPIKTWKNARKAA